MAKRDKIKGMFANLANQKSDSKEGIKNKIVTKQELQDLIPPLIEQEFIQLKENILLEGCRDPIVLWKNANEYVLIDGHNRYKICTQSKIDFKFDVKNFDNLDAVKDWMINNQLGKRNLTELQKSYLRGQQYRREKKKPGATIGNINAKKQSGQNVQVVSETREKLAEQHKVSSKTIQRDEKYAEHIDKFVGNDSNLKWKILTKEIDIPKNTLAQIAEDKKKASVLKKEIKKMKPVKDVLKMINSQKSAKILAAGEELEKEKKKFISIVAKLVKLGANKGEIQNWVEEV